MVLFDPSRDSPPAIRKKHRTPRTGHQPVTRRASFLGRAFVAVGVETSKAKTLQR
jgi:hypothetical protein